ncbi:hypothetical protein NPIL_482021 [Nephila pilipes]|uniref:Uncharacterized protein n=1 Tax=Nephila pilipes TaxID=299642 RepID=A0A8X6MFE8_NEPPI|nr:hypothetical protein NPIL_482021 [Nephila pilipes]
MLDVLTQVLNFYEIDTSNPSLALPRFPFTANRAVHKNIDISDGNLQFLDIFFDDNLLEMIVTISKLIFEGLVFRIPSSRVWI